MSDFERANVSAGADLLTPQLSIRPMSEIEPRVADWLWGRRIPLGAMTLVAGEPGCGKSFIAAQIAASISRGIALPGGPELAEPGDVIFLPFEDDAAVVLHARFVDAGANLDRIHIVDGVRLGEDVRDFRPEHVELLAEKIETLSCVRLVVIDPVMSLLSARDSFKSGNVRDALGPLVRLARDRNFALLIIAHLNKNALPALYRVEGSYGGFVGLSRSVLGVGRTEDDQRAIITMKSNYASKEGTAYTFALTEGSFSWGKPEPELRDDDVIGMRFDKGPSLLKDAEDAILDALSSGGWIASADLEKAMKDAGIALRTFERARRSLREKRRILRKGGSVVFWALTSPKTHNGKAAVVVLDNYRSTTILDRSTDQDGSSELPESPGPAVAIQLAIHVDDLATGESPCELSFENQAILAKQAERESGPSSSPQLLLDSTGKLTL